MCIIPARCSVYTGYVSSHFSSHWRETSVSLEVSVEGITVMRRRLQWAEAGGQPQCNRGAGTPSSPPDTRFVFTTGTSALIRDDLESPTSVGPCRFIFHHKFPGFPLSIKGSEPQFRFLSSLWQAPMHPSQHVAFPRAFQSDGFQNQPRRLQTQSSCPWVNGILICEWKSQLAR